MISLLVNRDIACVFYLFTMAVGHLVGAFLDIIIIIIISLFNVDAKNKVKNYNKKEIIVYIINYKI